jgi:glycosyltransferase involved in cell wall biosynthesis
MNLLVERNLPFGSLIIPCFDEEESLPDLLERCENLVSQCDIEVILVDNGSQDTTGAKIAEFVRDREGFKCVSLAVNKGYGGGILAGLAEASGQVLGWTHADLQTDPRDAVRGFEYISDPTSLIFVKGRRCGRRKFDELFTLGMSLLATVLFRYPLWDINAQPTILSRSLYERWSSPPKDFSLDLYAYVEAHRNSATVNRFSVRFSPRRHGVSHWNTGLRSRMRFIRRTLQYSLSLKRTYQQDHQVNPKPGTRSL